MEKRLILQNKYYKHCISHSELFEVYFDWCKSGNSNDTYYYVYKGDMAFYDSNNCEIYLNKDEYFENVIQKNNEFLDYLEKYYSSWVTC